MEKTKGRHTIAIVEGGKSPETGRNLFMAAKSLDISIIVLDRPGHWLEGPEYADWREAFLPIDRNPDPKFPERIVDVLQRYGKEEGALKIDGLTTFFDPLFVGVAAAAEKLGLMTSSPEAYMVATDKFKTSIAEGHLAYRASSVEEVVRIAQDARGLSYPLIVKPCSGWGSEGVFRVENEEELKDAVGAIDFERHGNDVVIEGYCNGPEVDANFVLVDGEVVFFEASDDFPKDADGEGDSALKTFIEVANILPSALPPNEMTILKKSLHQSLLNLGFKDGFFHLEARVKDSSMEFQKDEISGLVDLKLKKSKLNANPSAWLIEINPRPPGVQALLASARTYGIDYIGISLCFAIQDKEAAKALSIPFQYDRVGNGAQYWCEIVFIPVIKGGIFGSGDVCTDLRERCPVLAAHISKSHCFLQKGDIVNDPSSGLLNWIAYYLVFSHESRAHVLKLADSVRKETRFVVV
jgi:biotin carboxylase